MDNLLPWLLLLMIMKRMEREKSMSFLFVLKTKLQLPLLLLLRELQKKEKLLLLEVFFESIFFDFSYHFFTYSEKSDDENYVVIPQNLNPTQQALTEHQQEVMPQKKEVLVTFTKVDPSQEMVASGNETNFPRKPQSNSGKEREQNKLFFLMQLQYQFSGPQESSTPQQPDHQLLLNSDKPPSSLNSCLEQLESIEDTLTHFNTPQLLEIQLHLSNLLTQTSQILKNRFLLHQKL